MRACAEPEIVAGALRPMFSSLMVSAALLSPPRVAITGSTGKLGTEAVKQLVAAGSRVRALVRRRSRRRTRSAARPAWRWRSRWRRPAPIASRWSTAAARCSRCTVRAPQPGKSPTRWRATRPELACSMRRSRSTSSACRTSSTPSRRAATCAASSASRARARRRSRSSRSSSTRWARWQRRGTTRASATARPGVDYTIVRPGVMMDGVELEPKSAGPRRRRRRPRRRRSATRAIAALCVESLAYPNAAVLECTLTAMAVASGEGADTRRCCRRCAPTAAPSPASRALREKPAGGAARRRGDRRHRRRRPPACGSCCAGALVGSFLGICARLNLILTLILTLRRRQSARALSAPTSGSRRVWRSGVRRPPRPRTASRASAPDAPSRALDARLAPRGAARMPPRRTSPPSSAPPPAARGGKRGACVTSSRRVEHGDARAAGGVRQRELVVDHRGLVARRRIERAGARRRRRRRGRRRRPAYSSSSRDESARRRAVLGGGRRTFAEDHADGARYDHWHARAGTRERGRSARPFRAVGYYSSARSVQRTQPAAGVVDAAEGLRPSAPSAPGEPSG